MDSNVIPVQNTENGFTIFTHVIPPKTAPRSLQGVSTHREPKALGSIQIMIGFLTYLFGIVSDVYFETRSGYSDVNRWASMIYIGSGALLVAAANHPHLFVEKCSLVMSIISAVAAGVAIILLSFDIALPVDYYFYHQVANLWGVSRGMSGVLLVFSVLEFIISIYTSAYACKATCTATCCTEAPAVFISNPETHSSAKENV